MFRNPAAEFVYYRTYSRWLDSQGRRENWPETVSRFMGFIEAHRGQQIPSKVKDKIRAAVLGFEVMPSMRALWAAGSAGAQDNVSLYNCSYSNIDSPKAFAEGLYVLMCGAGWGFSVERKHVEKLPTIPDSIIPTSREIAIADSKAGWADSVKQLVEGLYVGVDTTFDYRQIRPQGTRLATMGGRASGPAPLITLHEFIRQTFYAARGRQLTSLEAHDICNQIAEIVVVGGVRRSSEISLSDLDDDLMAKAKTGNFPTRRYMANNSAVYYKKPSAAEFLREWAILAQSGSGERGVFNLGAARERAPRRRDPSKLEGANPCCEIVLRDQEFCNLSEVVVRADDDLDSLLEKVETATWLGIIQSTFTDFPYLGSQWKKNCEEERLLGVSLTGQMDNPSVLSPDSLKALKARALKVAKRASATMGIPMPAAVTCVKPSGTVSQVVDSASGLHPRYARYYIRRYRIAAVDPLYRMMRAQGVAFSAENGERPKDWDVAKKIYAKSGDLAEAKNKCPIFEPQRNWDASLVNTWVVSFPMKAPVRAVTVKDLTAIDQLEWYKRVQTLWCEHNASCTVYVRDNEWFAVGNWVYENWDIVGGLSFLPYDGGNYEQTPYEAINEEQYFDLLKKQVAIDYSQLSAYETEDMTVGSQTLACSGGSCELP